MQRPGGKQVLPGNVPVNYTPQSTNLDGHLSGIDLALAQQRGKPIRAGLPGNASGTPGQLQWFGLNTNNPAGVDAQTSAGNPGINNGNIGPYYQPNCTLVRAGLAVAHAAVAQGTTGLNMTARFELYDAQYGGRNLVAQLDFLITSAGTFNNLGGNNFQKAQLFGLSAVIDEGMLLGAQFTNRNGNNDEINGLGGIILYLEFGPPPPPP